MKKKYYLTGIILILLIGLVFLLKPHQDFLDKGKSTFVLKDTSSIDRILIIENALDSLEMEKIDNSWIFTDKTKVSKPSIKLFFNIMQQFSIFSPIPNKDKQRMIDAIPKHSIEILVSSNNKKKIHYFLIPDSTFLPRIAAVSDDFSQVLLLEIPGINEDPASFFETKIQNWSSNRVFEVNGNDLTMIEIQYTNMPYRSFKIAFQEDKAIIYSPQFAKPFETVKENLYGFLHSFQELKFNEKIIDMPLIDSLNRTPPFAKLFFKAKDSMLFQYFLHHIPIQPYRDETGIWIKDDPWFLWLVNQNEPAIYIVKYIDIEDIINIPNIP